MTTQDKTGEKLVASIRKTKAGTKTDSPEDSAKAGTSRRRPPARPAAGKRPAADAPASSGYQSPGRVWPD